MCFFCLTKNFIVDPLSVFFVTENEKLKQNERFELLHKTLNDSMTTRVLSALLFIWIFYANEITKSSEKKNRAKRQK